MKIKILDLSDKDLWKSSFSDLPVRQQDIYYRPEHYELYERKGDGKAHCFLFEKDGEVALYPFLLNPVNDLNLLELDKDYFDMEGAYGYNGVVSTSQNNLFRTAFYKAFNEYCSDSNIIAEFVRYHPILQNQKFSIPYIRSQFNRKTVFLDLEPGYERIWDQAYSSNNRNMIRKARKNHLDIVLSNKKKDYADFYHLYSETMQAVHAEPYYFFHEDYFVSFRDLLGGNQKLIKIHYKGEFICGLLLIIYGRFAHYHLSARRRKSGHLAANNLALDAAIQLAIAEGCKTFHFGGGNSTLESDPLLKFKSRFSRQKAEFWIGKKIHNERVYKKLVDAWEKKFPGKVSKYSGFLLKYEM